MTGKIYPNAKVGRGAVIDKGVCIGYPPCRQIKSKETILGIKARLRSGTIIYAGCKIGDYLETGHCVIIREENEIGNNVSVWGNSVIDYGCKIGNNVKIHTNCYVAQYTVLEDDVFLAPGVIIANDLHPGCKFSKKCMRGPTIKEGAQIGVNSTIFPYITIGERTLVGGGSVVTRDLPAESVAYGNPARVIKSIYELKCTRGFIDRPYKRVKK
jgi:acetyltransferase-like isoleucine patch superfamily enzyme